MFPANHGAAMGAYRDLGVESIVDSATPHQLVRMLFDGASAAVAAAKGHMQRQEIAAKGAAISQAISIIDGGLKVSLDRNVGGQMAQNLYDLYVYMSQRLLVANLKNDVAALDEVAELLQQLGGAWNGIATKQSAGAAGPKVSQHPGPAVPDPKQNRAEAAAPAKSMAAPNPPGQANAIAAASPTQVAGSSNANIPSQQSRLAAAYGIR